MSMGQEYTIFYQQLEGIFVRDRHLRVFPASVTFSKNKCNAINVSWQVVGNGPRIGVDSGTQSSCERDPGRIEEKGN